MGVIETNQWLGDFYEDPLKLCEKLREYFNGAQALEIYQYLTMHGMYQGGKEDQRSSARLPGNKVWSVIDKEAQNLREVWQGPDIPIFIFPADHHNPILKKDFNGKSGLSFRDKLFLFISPHNSEMELKALLSHEYNHVCRLTRYKKPEKAYVLLDTIISEGLAENAVGERFGINAVSSWVFTYSSEVSLKLWEKLIQPNRNLLKSSYQHQALLYGWGDYPKMAGYCAGYYLVKRFLDSSSLTSSQLLEIPSEELAH